VRFLDSDRNRYVFFDHQSVEVERLQRECEKLRAREQAARAEAEEVKERFERLASSSKAFAASIRMRTDERRRSAMNLLKRGHFSHVSKRTVYETSCASYLVSSNTSL
jgi:hypothetical protein